MEEKFACFYLNGGILLETVDKKYKEYLKEKNQEVEFEKLHFIDKENILVHELGGKSYV